MSDRCRAKNPSTCRVHGNAGQAIEVINKAVDKGRIQSSQLFAVAELLSSAENYDPKNTAKGMVVVYADGFTEVFVGDSTDPYKESDWSFSNASDYSVMSGADYGKDQGSDEFEQGRKSIAEYQSLMDDMLVGSSPIISSGPDSYTESNKIVKKVIVL